MRLLIRSVLLHACCGKIPHLQIDQAALTGESLPVKKFTGDVAFSGSTVKQGERHAVVYATGVNTFFGRAAALIGSTNNVANIQKVSLSGLVLIIIKHLSCGSASARGFLGPPAARLLLS